MDQSAIKEIQKAFLIEAANKVLPETQLSIVAQHSDFSIVSLEKYMGGRQRFRGLFETQSIDDYVTYCSNWMQEYQGGHVETHINAAQMKANSILNLGALSTPGHCDHNATLTCRRTAAYMALLSVLGSNSQMELSDFIEDWSEFIQVIDYEESVMPIRVAITGVRTVSMQRLREIESSVGDFENSASAFEKVEAKNKQQLPHYIHFTSAPYIGLSERKFVIRVGLITSRTEPVFSLRLVGQEKINDEIVEEFKSLLANKMNDLDNDVYLGGFKA